MTIQERLKKKQKETKEWATEAKKIQDRLDRYFKELNKKVDQKLKKFNY